VQSDKFDLAFSTCVANYFMEETPPVRCLEEDGQTTYSGQVRLAGVLAGLLKDEQGRLVSFERLNPVSLARWLRALDGSRIHVDIGAMEGLEYFDTPYDATLILPVLLGSKRAGRFPRSDEIRGLWTRILRQRCGGPVPHGVMAEATFVAAAAKRFSGGFGYRDPAVGKRLCVERWDGPKKSMIYSYAAGGLMLNSGPTRQMAAEFTQLVDELKASSDLADLVEYTCQDNRPDAAKTSVQQG
jgi:hypothetical protein